MGKWEKTLLGDVCLINPSLDTVLSNDVFYSVIPMDAVSTNGEILYKRKAKRDDISAGLTQFKNSDILFAKITPCMENGKCAIASELENGVGFGSTEFHVLRPSNKVDRRWLFHLVHSSEFRAEAQKNMTGSAGQKRVPTSFLRKYEILLPPLPIQQKIADALDKASALIEMRKAQIEKLDLLIKSQFIEMFGEKNIDKAGWETSTLEELCIDRNDIKCGPFGTQLSKSEYRKNGIPLWGIPQINSSFKLYPSDYLDSSKAEKLDAYSILPEDIVMSRKGNVGQCSLYPKKFEKGIMHSDVLRIRLNSKLVNPTYIMYQMRFSSFVEKQISRISNGAIMAGLNVQKLKKIALHVPNLSIQNHFACIVHNVDKQKELLHYSLEELKANYRSLMQKCFRGEMF